MSDGMVSGVWTAQVQDEKVFPTSCRAGKS